jgi:hypothetical protein
MEGCTKHVVRSIDVACKSEGFSKNLMAFQEPNFKLFWHSTLTIFIFQHYFLIIIYAEFSIFL